MRKHNPALLLSIPSIVLAAARGQDIPPVGPLGDGGHVVPTAQLIHPAGHSLEIAGRPVDLVLSPDGKTLYAKDSRGVVVIDAASWKVTQELKFAESGGSMVGLAVSRDGRRVFATSATTVLAEAHVEGDGKLKWARKIELPGPDGKGNSFPCGVALSSDDTKALVCLSRNNTLGIVDLESGKLVEQIAVGVAPYAVKLSSDGNTAFVTNWGGRRPKEGDKTSDSSGTQAVVDERGIAASGTVSFVDLRDKKQAAEVAVGLSPCGLELSADGKTLYVAAANSDTVSFIDVVAAKVRETLTVRVDDKLPFGSMPNGLALADDGNVLLVSLAGNNAIAVVRLGEERNRGGAESAENAETKGTDSAAGTRIAGFIPTGWYPGGIVARSKQLFVANIKGVGSRTEREKDKGWNSHWHRGTLSRVELPDDAALAKYTEQVRRESRVPQILKSIELAEARKDAKPVAVPANVGEPSVFEHIVYIIKENRTYDQVFGAIGKGNGDPKLCVFGREITPNHHAIAEQFVLLDNFYCNGVLSADGHSWATEGNVTPYLERSFGGFNRSYTFGDDPLTYSSSGFVWDHVLAKGLSFRNYGEFDEAAMEPTSDYPTVLKDWEEKAGKIKFKQKIGVEKVRKYTCPDFPGWNMDIPDKVRADVFLREFAEFEKNGLWPNFVIVYLPNDHTSGTGEGVPTPRSLVADNDHALGRIVEAVSKSRYWPKTCIFVIEDDPQNGFDHVDGHRSPCLVASPYNKRGAVVSKFYNQASVIHTMERIFGIPAHNQLYALAPIMFDCFTAAPDLTPYTCLPSNIKLAEMNKKAATLPPRERALAEASAKLPLDKPDRCDEDTLNRIVWHAMKGVDAAYPAEWAGAHGKGLEKLGLRLDPAGGLEEDDDDDDDD